MSIHKTHRFKSEKESTLADISSFLLDNFSKFRIFCFIGDLGAGKTTMIQHMCRKLSIIETASSPTYPIINIYHRISDEPVYHIDLYRINTLEEVFQLGFEEIIESNKYCFIEWAEKAKKLLFMDYVQVQINHQNQGRMIECSLVQQIR